MTEESQATETKQNDKEYNFRALENKFNSTIQAKEQELARIQREADELRQKLMAREEEPEEEEDDEPYVNKNKFKKSLTKFNQSTKSEIQKAMEQAKSSAKEEAKEEIKQELWLEANPDFYDVLQHVEKFANKAPKLAESILRMPDGFERQKLVYQNIKALGIDQPEQKASIQDKIDANRRTPYYQPTNMSSAPYSDGGDFSPQGQKQAFQKMQELKSRLRI